MKNKPPHHAKGILTAVALLIAIIDVGATGVTLAWDPSTVATDGTPITDISFYRLFYGVVPGAYNQYVDISSGTTATLTGLEYNKAYFFAVKAYTGNSESGYSVELTWTSPLMADTDTDRISDDWELRYSSTLSKLQEATDFDKDGISDLGEFIAGTNPLDANEFPTVLIASTLAGATVSFQAHPTSGAGYENRSRYYTLQQSDDLSSGTWSAVPGLEKIPAVDQIELHVIEPINANRFYQTKIFLE